MSASWIFCITMSLGLTLDAFGRLVTTWRRFGELVGRPPSELKHTLRIGVWVRVFYLVSCIALVAVCAWRVQ